MLTITTLCLLALYAVRATRARQAAVVARSVRGPVVVWRVERSGARRAGEAAWRGQAQTGR